jgi:hypothetical protein
VTLIHGHLVTPYKGQKAQACGKAR